MSKNLSPARLNMTDLPRDKQHYLGALRKALVASANYSKRYPAKRLILMKTLGYVYKYLEKTLKADQAKQADKEAADEALEKAKALAEKETKEAAEAQLALLKLQEKQSGAK